MNDLLKNFTEFETKYRIDEDKLQEFKILVDSFTELKSFLYVEGYDYYYVHSDGSFLRYRKGDYDKSNRAELTIKHKREEKHNVNRMEVNLRVDYSSKEEIKQFANVLNYHYNFHIWKSCHIYHFPDAVVVYYTVRDSDKKLTNFIEIEVNEHLKVTEDQAWDIIRKYESVLSSLGVTPQKRLRKSLYEMYKKS